MHTWIKRASLTSAVTGLLLGGSIAAFGQAATQNQTTTPGGCTSGNAAEMSACQNMQGSQQLDSTVGNGGTPGAQVAPGNIGTNGVNTPSTAGKVGHSTENPTNGTSTTNSVNGSTNNGANGNGTNNASGTNNANGTNGANGSGGSSGSSGN